MLNPDRFSPSQSKTERNNVAPAWLSLRLLALTHLAALLSLGTQIHGLIGADGLSPLLERRSALPLLFALTGGHDGALSALLLLGAVAALLLLFQRAQRPSLLILWLITQSLIRAASPFLSYQWDILLAETTLLSFFWAPSGWWKPTRTSAQSRWTHRWLPHLLLVKLIFASGVVKLKSGDPNWSMGEALSYHYWTQPLPAEFAWWMHQLPDGLRRLSEGAVFLIELWAPLLLFCRVPSWPLLSLCGLFLFTVLAATVGLASAAGITLVILFFVVTVLMDERLFGHLIRDRSSPALKALAPVIAYLPSPESAAPLLFAILMGVITLTGSYGFFQLLTLSICAAALAPSDARRLRHCLRIFSSSRMSPQEPVSAPASDEASSPLLTPHQQIRDRLTSLLSTSFLSFWLIYSLALHLSWFPRRVRAEAWRAWAQGQAEAPLTRRLLGAALHGERVLRRGLSPWIIAGRYGLFARMTTTRYEITIEGSEDGKTWSAYRLPYKPNATADPLHRAWFHMPRLDWQLWFAGLRPRCRRGWFTQLLRALAEDKREARALFSGGPTSPPLYLRALRQSYHFTSLGAREVWEAGPREIYCPARAYRASPLPQGERTR
ncbi:MAG: lipase maturation factor family protein [Myxococcota bacterium]|nr:lipase maturation factor family protein [Myxococcota bacterium]